MDAALKKGLSKPAQRAISEARVSQHIPYTRHVDRYTLETRDGHLLQVLKIEGFAFETADQDEINHLKTIRNTMLRGVASSNYALWHHIIRRRADQYPAGDMPPGFAADLDRQWRAHLSQRRMFVNDMYLTVVQRVPAGVAGAFSRFMRAFSEKVDREAAAQARLQAVKELNDRVSQIEVSLKRYGVRRLGVTQGPYGLESEALSFMQQIMSGERRRTLLPEMNLSQYLGTVRPFFGRKGIELRGSVGSRYASIMAIKEYRADTVPGMMDRFLQLPYEAVITQSFAFIDRQPALESMRRQQAIMENASEDALSQIEELTEGLDDLASGRYAFGSHHMTIMPLTDSLEALDKASADAYGRLTDMGVISVREGEGAEEISYWAQLPGNFGYIPRPAPISTLNFASFASFHNHPEGQIDGNHWGPALTLLETTSDTPLYFSFHVGDLGNTTIVGPSGTGKTLTMCFLLAQAERIKPRPRIVYFDKDRGAEIFLRALGGKYMVIERGHPTGWNPLDCEETPRSKAFLVRLLSAMVTSRGESLTPTESERLRVTVDNAFTLPREKRRLGNIAAFVPRAEEGEGAIALEKRLAPWHGSGEYAWLFDHATDTLSLENRIMGFDLTSILDDPVARTPALLYMFERADQVLDGKPTIIGVDEGWKALSDPAFSPRIEDWERTIRKRNGMLLFGSQSASSIVKIPMGSVIIEQSPTQIFMPNRKADPDSYIEGFGLTDREFDLIRELPDDSRCFLVKHGRMAAVAKLDMGGLDDAIAVLSSRESTVRLLDEIRAEVGDDPADWLPVFHERRK